jgi:NAD(P)-dependent dehydrogenase (short-subunit alcohol dehydrogenase family)
LSIILITGCSSGFGRGAALALARRGESVIATVRDAAARVALQDEAARSGTDLEVVELDITDPRSRDACLADAHDRHGRLDVLINNAGILSFGPLESLGEADLRSQFETNVFAAVALMLAVLPGMRTARSGRIVNVTSVAAFGVRPFMTGYAATKHALDAISSGMDRELRHFDIRVTSVAAIAFLTRIARTRPDVNTPYGEAPMHSFEQFQERIQRRTDIAPAVEAIVEAATAAAPKHRYLVAPGEAAFDEIFAAKERFDGARGIRTDAAAILP